MTSADRTGQVHAEQQFVPAFCVPPCVLHHVCCACCACCRCSPRRVQQLRPQAAVSQQLLRAGAVDAVSHQCPPALCSRRSCSSRRGQQPAWSWTCKAVDCTRKGRLGPLCTCPAAGTCSLPGQPAHRTTGSGNGQTACHLGSLTLQVRPRVSHSCLHSM